MGLTDIMAASFAAFGSTLHRSARQATFREQRFEVGFDLGCGAPASVVASRTVARAVFAVDPSLPVSPRAEAAQSVTRLPGRASALTVVAQRKTDGGSGGSRVARIF